MDSTQSISPESYQPRTLYEKRKAVVASAKYNSYMTLLRTDKSFEKDMLAREAAAIVSKQTIESKLVTEELQVTEPVVEEMPQGETVVFSQEQERALAMARLEVTKAQIPKVQELPNDRLGLAA